MPRTSSASKRLRLFIALELPEAMKHELAATQERLRRELKFPLKWVRPEGMHLTLKFLGGVDEPRVTAIQEALADAVRDHTALSLHLGELGSFGGRRPHVAWVGIDGELDRLTALQSAIDRATATLGFEPEKRAYSAHLTLARVPDGLSRLQQDELLHAIAHLPPPAPAGATFRAMSLMESTLKPTGAVYSRLFVVELG